MWRGIIKVMLERVFQVFNRIFSGGKTEFYREVTSLNGRLLLSVELKRGKIFYELKKDEKILVKKSELAMVIVGESAMDESLALVREQTRAFDEKWETIYGEQREIENKCREIAFYLAEQGGDRRLITLRFRLFDEGMAFRYELPVQPKYRQVVVSEERTEFNIDINSNVWQIPAFQFDRYEYNYEKTPVYEIKGSVHTPLLAELSGGGVVAIHEAALYDYGAMTLKLANDKTGLISDITPLSDGTLAKVGLPFATPWRVIMVGDSVLDLVTNRMVLNLNDPPREDFSWVKPIKFMGIWWAMFVGEWTWAPGDKHGATTEHAIEYINACKELGIRGLLVEGWNNGWEGDWLKNGEKTIFTEPAGDFDMDEIATYAKMQGVEIVGHHETVGFIDNYDKQLNAAYKYYTERGIRYIKSGYAGSMMTTGGVREFHHSQVGVRHYQKALELAAKYHIMLDVHEPIKGTGIERTWPNVLTREGARGQEYEGGAILPSHVCILPFTRLLAGGMDYTSGIFDVSNNVKRIASTLARQLAYYVVIYSGMQMAADRPWFYTEKNRDLFKFIQDLPLSYEKTVPLLGVVGEYYVVARQDRESSDWVMGGVTNEQKRIVHIDLNFLEKGVKYDLEIYRDADDAHYRENQLAYKIENRRVTAEDNLAIFMAAGGGFAARFRKVYETK